MKNYLSIDFESWTYPNLPEFLSLSSQKRKALDHDFVKISAERILKLLAKHKVKLTFFILGELYEWFPEVFDWIVKEGHEIAYHTHQHDILTSPKTLTKTIGRSKTFLEKYKPRGFRAPAIMIKKEYLPILKKHGFGYDSSIYGPDNFKKKVEGILEIPISTFPLFDYKPKFAMPRGFGVKNMVRELPIGSGYLIALLGLQTGWFIKRINQKNQPFIGFMHNWQIIKPLKPSFPSKFYLLTHPLYLPYTRDCYKIFEYLLFNFEFSKMNDLMQRKR